MQDSNLRPFRYERTATNRAELIGLKWVFNEPINICQIIGGVSHTDQIYQPSQRVSPI